MYKVNAIISSQNSLFVHKMSDTQLLRLNADKRVNLNGCPCAEGTHAFQEILKRTHKV